MGRRLGRELPISRRGGAIGAIKKAMCGVDIPKINCGEKECWRKRAKRGSPKRSTLSGMRRWENAEDGETKV